MAADNKFARLLKSTASVQSAPVFLPVALGKRKASGFLQDQVGSQSDPGKEELVSKRWRPPRKKKEVDAKLNRTIFVGNIPASCTRKELKKQFSEFGQIESVRFRSVIGRRAANSKRPLLNEAVRCNAYVVFKEADSVEPALTANGTTFKEHLLRVDRTDKRPREHAHDRSVFVGNVPHEVTDEEFQAAFGDCGEVESVRLGRDRKTGLCRGFGYVLFKDKSAVVLALKYKRLEIQGRRLRVSPSRANPRRQKGRKGLPIFAGAAANQKGNSKKLKKDKKLKKRDVAKSKQASKKENTFNNINFKKSFKIKTN